jgi:hypothetical protein
MGDYIEKKINSYHTTLLNQGGGLSKPDIFVAKSSHVPLFSHELGRIKRERGVANVPQIVAQRLGNKTLLVLRPIKFLAQNSLVDLYWHVVGISADDRVVHFRLLPNAALTYFWQPEPGKNCYKNLLKRSRKQEDNSAPPYIATLSVAYEGGNRYLEFIPGVQSILANFLPPNISREETFFIGEVDQVDEFYYLSHNDNPICEFPREQFGGEEGKNPTEDPVNADSCFSYKLDAYLTECLSRQNFPIIGLPSQKRQYISNLQNSDRWRKGAPPLGIGQQSSRLPEMFAAALTQDISQKDVP